MANKKFTTIPHDQCIIFDNFAKVELCQEDPSVFGGQGFNFRPIKFIQESVQLTMLDVIAVITESGPVSQMQFKNSGEWKDKRNLVLSDDSGVSIELTIFGADAGRQDLEPGTIIAIREAKVSDYRGKSLTVWDGQA